MVMKYLEEAASKALLTQVGKDWYSEIKKVYDEQRELEGVLTKRGGKENPQSSTMILLGDPQGYVKYDINQPSAVGGRVRFIQVDRWKSPSSA